ncbi:MAG: hypothetical protein HY898_25415 [Deltaproteobacteria bacterium]|nr:hypothetical protein [Deltaproteobacteria bacterium]
MSPLARTWILRGAAAVAVVALAGCSCGDCCRCASKATEKPPETVVQREVGRSMESKRDVASILCGVSVEGLKDVTVTIVKDDIPLNILGTGHAKVEGTAIQSTRDGGSVVKDPTKALVCTGVVSFMLMRKHDEPDPDKAWKLTALDVWEVNTPGVSWKRPSSHHHH